MRRPPTGPRLVTHSSPWLQHKATSPGGRFLPEERLWLPEKAQEEEEAEEEEGNRRFPNTLSEGAVRGSRPWDARRRESGPGLPAAPFPLPRPAQTRNKVAESDWAGGWQPRPGALAAAAPAPGQLGSGRADGGRRRRRSPRRRPEQQRRRRRRGDPRGCSSSREGRPSPIDGDQERQGRQPRRSGFAAPGPEPVVPPAAAAPSARGLGTREVRLLPGEPAGARRSRHCPPSGAAGRRVEPGPGGSRARQEGFPGRAVRKKRRRKGSSWLPSAPRGSSGTRGAGAARRRRPSRSLALPPGLLAPVPRSGPPGPAEPPPAAPPPPPPPPRFGLLASGGRSAQGGGSGCAGPGGG
ncbi:collagen alpha-1(I) chain-like [Diceros bicornis minor]|uniref:collagen alpha-1(I) chain-like n=1 Tax=Diceros bicornis minor TaxID=77932 RepID=UPI0026EA1D7D|nr:collagen alpha-1(I) chain-like [Diceros bicornis minor]